MRTWDLSASSPYSLRIAADVRTCTPNYLDDQIWELRLGRGEPPSQALITTYGLRARSMQIFPGFRINGQVVIDPDSFFESPRIRRFFPNYLLLDCQPFQGIQVNAEYWVVASDVLAGRFNVTNLGAEPAVCNLILHAILRPRENPQVMTEREFDGVLCLSGRSGDCCPVVFLAGGALMEHSPYPALRVGGDLHAGETRSFLWAHSGRESPIASYAAARECLQRPFDEEIARLEIMNAAVPEIYTGDEERDAVLAFSQKVALGSLVGPTRHLSHPSPIAGRHVDRGYSEAGDGSDYDWQWKGQSAIDAYLTILSLLSIDFELAKGIFQNFLEVQGADGFIDWKPGLAGQRDGALCIPILSHIAWKIFMHTEDHGFLNSCFDALLEFTRRWFDPRNDRDQDGHPEWDSTLQSGFDDWPSFVLWQAWGEAFPISEVETPDLAAYLLNECSALIRMADLLDRSDALDELRRFESTLREGLLQNWIRDQSIFQHKDRDLHSSPSGELLLEGSGSFSDQIKRTFEMPKRIVVKTECQEGTAHPIKITLRGKGRTKRGRTEKLTKSAFHWFWDIGTTLVDRPFTQVDSAEISHVPEEFHTEIRTPDLTRQDQTCILPLFAGHMELPMVQRMVQTHLLNEKKFWRRNGIPNTSAQDPAYSDSTRNPTNRVQLFWNTLIAEGLLDYGYKAEVVELVQKLIIATGENLRTNKAFRSAYHADRYESSGEIDHVIGIAPIGLFLEILGLRLVSENKVVLNPDNPFPWPIWLKWKNLEIHWLEDGATVRFGEVDEIHIQGNQQVMVQRGEELE
jgi:hypothetical protein